MFMQGFLFTVSLQCVIRAVCVICFSVCGASTASAETSTPRPYRAVWPEGWEVSYLPSPKTDSGKNLGGERVRVLLKVDGVAVAAAIELTYFPRSDKGQTSSAEEFAQVRENMQAIYQQHKFQVNLTPTQSILMGGQSALTTELSIANDSRRLKQWIGVVLSPQFFYSLTFTAGEENFARFLPQFDAVKQSITLQ